MKNTQSASATSRRLASALLVIGLTVGTIAATATPVEAASYVGGCFAPYRSGMTVVAMPVKLQASANPYDSRYPWIDLTSTTIFANGNGGCVGWSILDPALRGFVYFRLVIDYPYYLGRYTAVSPLIALPGEGVAFLQTATIYCSTC